MTRHFLRDDDLTPAELVDVLDLAEAIKADPHRHQPLHGPKSVALIFDKPTLRTQLSFSAGIAELGGAPIAVDTRLAAIGKHVGVDLWHYRTPKGGSLFKSVDFLIPTATGGLSHWPYQEIGFTQYAALDDLHAAADAGDSAARAALPHVPVEPGGDLYPVRPAAEQLDDISLTG